MDANLCGYVQLTVMTAEKYIKGKPGEGFEIFLCMIFYTVDSGGRWAKTYLSLKY